MKQITSKEFNKAIELDPDWPEYLTEDVEVTDYCNCEDSKIKTLSTRLFFTGVNDLGWSANFANTHNLKKACGNFKGSVFFNHSNIQKIEDLNIQNPSIEGDAAFFTGCKNLKAATGTYPGAVCFAWSTIQEVKDLQISKENRFGISLNLSNTKELKSAEGSFPGKVHIDNSTIEKFKNFRITRPNKHGEKATIANCPRLKKIPKEFLEKGYFLDETLKSILIEEISEKAGKTKKINEVIQKIRKETNIINL